MDEVNRRRALGLAAVAGAAVLAAPAAADDPPAPPFDEAAERARVIAAGMTAAEADCWVLLAKAVGAFFALPKLHPMDQHEVAVAAHVLQNKLLSRPAYRVYTGGMGVKPK